MLSDPGTLQGRNGAVRDETLLQLTLPAMFVQVKHILFLEWISILFFTPLFAYSSAKASMELEYGVNIT